jgi:sugar phosphate isomerase/epimerase
MRVGISTACFYPRINTEDTIEIISKLGFNICEVFLETEMETSLEFCRELKRKADFYGIEIYSGHPFSVSFEPFLFDRYKRRKLEMEKRFIMSAGRQRNWVQAAMYFTGFGKIRWSMTQEKLPGTLTGCAGWPGILV